MCVFSVMFGRYDEKENPLFYSYSDIDSSKYPRTKKVFKSGENKLCGYYYTTSRDSIGTVIVINGYHCTSDRHLSEIMYFVDNNWSVFTFDGTGVGQSDGDSQIGLAQSRLDTAAAVEYVGSLSSKPVVLYGHSEGAYAAVTSLNDSDRVSAVVSVSGFNSPLELMHRHTKNHIGFLADIEYPFMYAHNYVLLGENSNTQAYEAINSTDTPVAVFQGKNDTTVPYDISIYSHRDELRNPNAACFEVGSSRGNHSTIWLSDSAAEYTMKYRQNPFKNPDKKKANELDGEFMEYVLKFYGAAIK
ncbi:MAG: alpha/beta hydrolase [Ruminococcus sp.]|nr:alpha/beta hydrolase [Ruminococcus sp.]